MNLHDPRTLTCFRDFSNDTTSVERLVEAGRTTDGAAGPGIERIDSASPHYIGPIEAWEIRGDRDPVRFDLWLYWSHGGHDSSRYGVVFPGNSALPVAYIAQARFYLCAIVPPRARFADALQRAARDHPDTELARVPLTFDPEEDWEFEAEACPACGVAGTFRDTYLAIVCLACHHLHT